MDIDVLTVTDRSETGKGPNRRLRAQGLVPAVLYGTNQEPIKLSLNYRELGKALSKPNAETNLYNLTGSGLSKETTVILREIQRDPLSRRFLHVDLLTVALDKETDFEVPIHSKGTPIGVREGGILETHLRSIVVRCLPKALPESIIADIANLAANKAFHVSDLELPENVSLVTDPAEVLYAVHAKRGSTTSDEAEEAAEPEVIGKKKED